MTAPSNKPTPSDPRLRDRLRDLLISLLARHLATTAEGFDTSRSLMALGLSSLQSMILLGEIESETGLELDVEVFGEEFTIDELIALIAARLAPSP